MAHPRWSTSPLVMLVVLALLLSGCTKEPAPQAPAEDPLVFTSPTDIEALDDPNAGMRDHLHDYWDGASSLVVLDAAIMTGATYSEELAVASFRPEPGVVVPQGAASLNVTVGWTDDDPTALYDHAELWVKTAAMDTPLSFGTIDNGATVELPTTNDDNDLPHQILSGWVFEFVLYPDTTAGFVRFGGEVTLHATAHRGLEIPLYPPHPDQWQGATQIGLFEDTQQSIVYTESLFGQNCISGCFQVHTPKDGAIVPLDAVGVEVVLTYGPETQTEAALRYHASDAREWVPIEPESKAAGVWTYWIPVDRGMGDGPYAKQSLWEFEVYLPQDVAPAAAFTGEYAITATVYRTA